MFKTKGNVFFILLALEAILILALLPGCFREQELVDTFFGEDIMESLTQEDGHREFSGNRLVLNPGVYQIRAWTRLADGESMYVEMDYDNAYYKSLRNNGMVFFPGSDYGDFNVYVLDKVSSAYVKCSFFDVGSDALERLEIWKTNMGNKMLLIILAAFFAALDFLVIFRKRILEGKVTRKQQIVFWTLTGGVFLACFPYLTDYFSGGADTFYHVERVAFLADALKDGSSLPVRMQGTWLYGHGYATSLFYGDFFLYIPALLCLAGFSIMSAYKCFIFLVTAATAVIAYFSFKKCVKEEYAALFGSMVYLLTSYRIFNVYNRGAMGEYLAAAFLPLVCCGMYLLYTEDAAVEEYKKYKWYVVWGMSALLQSHLISTELAAAFMVLVCVVFWKKTFRKNTFLQLLQATGIVVLINMWFWLPMLYMLNNDAYKLQRLISGEVNDKGILLGNLLQLLPNKGAGNVGVFLDEPIQLGNGVMILLLAYILGRYWKKEWDKKEICLVLAIFSILTLAVSTAYFPWGAISKIPGIGFLAGSMQFASRWLGASSALSAMFACFFFRMVREEGSIIDRTVIGIAAVVTVASAVYHVGSIAIESGPIWLYNVENMGTVSVINGEWLLQETDDSKLYYHEPVAEEGLIWSGYEKRGTNVEIILDNRTDQSCYIEIPLTGYKGYGVDVLDGESAEMPSVSEERGAHGDLRLAVPAGYQGRIRISYKGFALFHVAEAVSFVGMAAVLGTWLWKQRHRRVRRTAMGA